MIFNFTRNHQFTTHMKLLDNHIEVVKETKLLGTIITSDLKWNKNTEALIKKANQRMQIIHRIAQYNPKKRRFDKHIHAVHKICVGAVLSSLELLPSTGEYF